MAEKTKKSSLRREPPGMDLEKARRDFLQEPDQRKKATDEPEPSEGSQQESLEEEIVQQEQPKKVKVKARLPWEDPSVSPRVLKAFQLRLPEPDFLKLKYVVERSREKSIHSFLSKIIQKEVKKELNNLLLK